MKCSELRFDILIGMSYLLSINKAQSYTALGKCVFSQNNQEGHGLWRSIHSSCLFRRSSVRVGLCCLQRLSMCKVRIPVMLSWDYLLGRWGGRRRWPLGLLPHSIFLASRTLKYYEIRALHKMPQILESWAGLELYIVCFFISNSLLLTC